MLSRTCSKIPSRLLGKATVVLGAIMMLACPACEKEKTFEDELASAFRACGLLSSGKTTNFWFTDNVYHVCGYRCYPQFQCADGSEVVPARFVCNDYDNCADGSDEIGCAHYICDI